MENSTFQYLTSNPLPLYVELSSKKYQNFYKEILMIEE